MKRTFLDKLVGVFSPAAELRRVQSRVKSELTLRAYDIAKTFNQSDWSSARASSSNEENKAAIAPGRNKARALVQNNPYGVSAVNEIVSSTVGAGIVPKITGRNKSLTKKLNELWKEIAETTACDKEKRNNFYALQALIMRSMVESGEGLGIINIDPSTGPKLQLLEADHIVTLKDTGNIKQGIEFDTNGSRIKYHLFKVHPGESVSSTAEIAVPVENIVHVYKQDRPGQIRGVTWAHAVVEKMKDFDDYQNATLIRQKIAACFTAFVTTSNDSLLDPATLKEKREAQFAMSPASINFLNPGDDVKLASPPSVDGYAEFNREQLRATASGWGITYEGLTGDYSQSNYSSSRLANIKFRRNVDVWRWNILIPQFCDPFFAKFLEYAKLKGIDVNDATVKWVAPANVQIDPGKEIKADKEAVLAGFKSRSEVIREAGNDPEIVLEEIKEERAAALAAGVKFDTDNAGEQSSDDEKDNPDEENQEDSTDEPNKGVVK